MPWFSVRSVYEHLDRTGDERLYEERVVLFEDPTGGVEVFSLMRTSRLAQDAYLDHFFDTGTERQHPVR